MPFDEPFKPSLASFEFGIVRPLLGIFLDQFSSQPFSSILCKFTSQPVDQLLFHFMVNNLSACSCSSFDAFFPSDQIVGRNIIYFCNLSYSHKLGLFDKKPFDFFVKNFVAFFFFLRKVLFFGLRKLFRRRGRRKVRLLFLYFDLRVRRGNEAIFSKCVFLVQESKRQSNKRIVRKYIFLLEKAAGKTVLGQGWSDMHSGCTSHRGVFGQGRLREAASVEAGLLGGFRLGGVGRGA